MTRRQAVAGLGTTLAAVAVAPALGATDQQPQTGRRPGEDQRSNDPASKTTL